MSAKLRDYRAKRNFSNTPEPAPRATRPAGGPALRFVVQRHDATRLHYDFRLEHAGVLKSWAVTKAPSRDPAIKRLAVEVEDHPLDYGGFEGTIPKGNYGAGTVQLWDEGTWSPVSPDVDAALAAGELKVNLTGRHLRGGWVLVRLKTDRGKPAKRQNWLLIKERDAEAVPGDGDTLAAIDTSVRSGRSVKAIASGDTAAPPGFLPIQLCDTADHPPTGADWLHEIKFDGYRLQIAIGGGRAVLRTRSGLDWTERFPELAAAAATWPPAVLDGELCALDTDGTPDFTCLQAALAAGDTAALHYFAFDLLQEAGEDRRDTPLHRRKAALEAYVAGVGEPKLRYVAHFGSAGAAVLESACRMHLEGVVSKHRDAPYRAGRGPSWVKSKCRGRDEVVIGGWIPSGNSGLRSLLVGVQEGGALRYLGRVGTGFREAGAKLLLTALREAAATASPFAGKGAPSAADGVRWVAPTLVAEIAHGGRTDAGLLRHAAYKGLREDKPAAAVDAKPQPPATVGPTRRVVAGVTISNPAKLLWPTVSDRPGISKLALAEYMEMAAERLLPHVANRPVSVLRAPDGIAGETFFQRHAMAGGGPRLGTIDVHERKPYLTVSDVGGLVALAQSGGIELHPWGCRPGDPETPEQLTFDLDPAEDVGFDAVIAAALALRAPLEALGLRPFVKTTGGKGLHVVVPIAADARRRVTWDAAKAFAKAVCEQARVAAPDRYTTTLAKRARTGRIFLDYLRNGRMATAVAPWSLRARPSAGIALPLGWAAVRKGLDPAAFHLGVAASLLAQPDPWTGFRDAAVSLRPALRKLGVPE